MVEPAAFRERLVWHAEEGEIRDGSVRYMLIRPDALMAIFTGLPASARDAALEAFRVAVATYGSRSAANYQAVATAPLIDVVAATAPQLGWGRWTVATTATGYVVTVVNSPFVAGFGTSDCPVCAPIAGMLQAVATLMGGADSRAYEAECAAIHAAEPRVSPTKPCRFCMILGERQ